MPISPVSSAIDSPREVPSAPQVTGASFAEELSRRAVIRAKPANGVAHVVEKLATPLSGSQAAAALKTAWESLFHEAPQNEQLSILVAQWSHETAGGSAMMNYNFGGIKGKGPSGLSAAYRTTEGFGATERKITDQFRAYTGASEGATDYLTFLRDRFPGALEQVKKGNATGFVQALKRGGYFTDSEDSYARSVAALTSEVRTQGYDAVDRVGAAFVPTRSADSSKAAPPGQMSLFAVDAAAMADELSRAALRIAASRTADDS